MFIGDAGHVCQAASESRPRRTFLCDSCCVQLQLSVVAVRSNFDAQRLDDAGASA